MALCAEWLCVRRCEGCGRRNFSAGVSVADHKCLCLSGPREGALRARGGVRVVCLDFHISSAYVSSVLLHRSRNVPAPVLPPSHKNDDVFLNFSLLRQPDIFLVCI